MLRGLVEKNSIGTDRSVDELEQLATSQIISDMKEMKKRIACLPDGRRRRSPGILTGINSSGN